MSGPNERDELAADREALAEVLRRADDAALVRTNFAQLVAAYDESTDAILASDWLAERDRRTAATALRAMGARFRNEGRETWGGDVGWTTTGGKVAALAASWCDEEADRIEAPRG